MRQPPPRWQRSAITPAAIDEVQAGRHYAPRPSTAAAVFKTYTAERRRVTMPPPYPNTPQAIMSPPSGIY